jgi:hypothetical protein
VVPRCRVLREQLDLLRGRFRVVVTVTDGDYGNVQNATVGSRGIECAGATCWAAGQDTLQKITKGLVTGSPVTDTAVQSFTGIARRGTAFAAIGETHSARVYDVVTG